MELSKKTVEEFREIFKKECGVEYSDQEAWEATHNLVGYFDLLLKIDHRQMKDRENMISP